MNRTGDPELLRLLASGSWRPAGKPAGTARERLRQIGPAMGLLGASMVPGVGEAMDTYDVGAGIVNRDAGQALTGLLGLALPFVGAGSLKRVGAAASAPTPRRAMKPEPPDWLEDLRAVGGLVDDDDTVVLYHATTKDKADQILAEGVLRRPADAPDDYGVYFSSSPEVARDYGDGTVLPVRVRLSDVDLDDMFPGKRMDFLARTNKGVFRPIALGPSALRPKK